MKIEPIYIKAPNLFLLFIICKLIERKTFENVMNWINFVKTIENPLIVLIANKTDLQRYEVKKNLKNFYNLFKFLHCFYLINKITLIEIMSHIY